MEVIKHTHTINFDYTFTWSHSSNSLGSLTLTEAPCSALRVQFTFTLLLRKCSSEIINIQSIKFWYIIQHMVSLWIWEITESIIHFISILSEIIIQVMFKVRILFEWMEQWDFKSLVRGQWIKCVVCAGVLVFYSFNYIS